MRVLPFHNLPVVEYPPSEKAPTEFYRLTELLKWADGDYMKYSVAFIACDGDPSVVENYLFQIGFVRDNALVTNVEVIEYVGSLAVEMNNWVDYMEALPKIREHLSLYYEKVESIPPWGTREYQRLVKIGKTPRVLFGPHKGGRVKKNQKRFVVYNEKREYVYGPIIP
jgi:hypothetical protein